MNESRQIDTVLFDLDGTLLDTNELIIASFRAALRDAAPSLERERIVAHMGKPLREQLRIFSGRDGVDDLEAAYRTFNLAHHDAYVKAFPHVREVVSRLYESGVKLGVVTTKLRFTTMKGLALCGLDGYFGAIVTLDDVSRPKPDPEPVEKALALLRADAPRAMMVGDSPADIEAANRAGVVSAAVAWSLKGEAMLEAYHPRVMVRDMRELLALCAAGAEKRA